MNNSKKTICRDESKLHSMPSILTGVLAVELLSCLILFITLVVMLILKDYNMVTIAILTGVLALLLIHGWFCDWFYNWQECARYEITRDLRNITYLYNLNKCSMASNTTVAIKFNKITSYKVRGKKCILKGEFSKKMPLRKTSIVNKITVPVDFTDSDYILNAFNMFKKVR